MEPIENREREFLFEEIDFNQGFEVVIDFRKKAFLTREFKPDTLAELINDSYDQYARHFILRNKAGEVVANVRIIDQSKGRLPLEEGFKNFIPNRNSVEISRLIVNKDNGKLLIVLLSKLRNVLKGEYRNSDWYIDGIESLSDFYIKLGFSRSNFSYFDDRYSEKSFLFEKKKEEKVV